MLEGRWVPGEEWTRAKIAGIPRARVLDVWGTVDDPPFSPPPLLKGPAVNAGDEWLDQRCTLLSTRVDGPQASMQDPCPPVVKGSAQRDDGEDVRIG